MSTSIRLRKRAAAPAKSNATARLETTYRRLQRAQVALDKTLNP